MPGPASTRYAVPVRTTATAGPERSGSAFGVPVPSMTMRVVVAESACAAALRGHHVASRSAIEQRTTGVIARRRRSERPRVGAVAAVLSRRMDDERQSLTLRTGRGVGAVDAGASRTI